ncbi:TolB family protein [Desulforamulus aeronauticus]|uniref:WD40-like Beta Propeller Repeat n=1 Tax=Desulforamulus aeronauticus DSM 10349 TaxID=1121421 RepID=A0A1M6W505_9FIRM|nr:hypothetical protein [Desulforamulus aeronauticus]SHK88840.1 WD40-like Beta Propeller Repeat [Desulforamulus aeronauticus DSM 10349]
MKRKWIGVILASIFLASSIAGCVPAKDQPLVQPAKKDRQVVEKVGQEVLKDIDLPAKGVHLFGYHQDLVLSPAGTSVAFSGYFWDKEKNVKEQMVLANLVTGEVTTFDGVSKVLGWLPDNNILLYQTESTLSLLNSKNRSRLEISKDCWYGSISPDGKQIAYTVKGKGLMVYTIESAKHKQLTKNQDDWYPIWYPDSKQLFYFSDLQQNLGDGAGHLQGMAKISIETSEVTRLTDEEGKFRRAEWIIPGKSLHIVRGWDDGFYHGILNLSQNKYTDLGENLMDSSYFVAVDSKTGLLFKTSFGQVDIFDAIGNKQESYSLQEKNRQNFYYTPSPNGYKLAFVQGDYDRFLDSKIKGNKVMISDYDGQNVKELTPEYTYNDSIVWDKTGKHIITLQRLSQEGEDLISGLKILPIK